MFFTEKLLGICQTAQPYWRFLIFLLSLFVPNAKASLRFAHPKAGHRILFVASSPGGAAVEPMRQSNDCGIKNARTLLGPFIT